MIVESEAETIEKGARLYQINDDELSDISFDDEDEDESSESDDGDDEWTLQLQMLLF
jgi:hypothetical protein